jgi:hypothetical protein
VSTTFHAFYQISEIHCASRFIDNAYQYLSQLIDNAYHYRSDDLKKAGTKLNQHPPGKNPQ